MALQFENGGPKQSASETQHDETDFGRDGRDWRRGCSVGGPAARFVDRDCHGRQEAWF